MNNEKAVPAVRQEVPATGTAGNRRELLKRLSGDTSVSEIPAIEEDVPQDILEILVFRLGPERYGMDIQNIVQIVRFQEPAPVPHTVPFLDGIISLRGQMIPVINGRKRLGHEARPPDKRTRIIVVRDPVEHQGILVDSTTQVLGIPRTAIEPTPPVVAGMNAEFIDGVCHQKGHLIILLNLERFLQLV